ncbi:MAG: AAA family ATPase, partial [Andreesenia angusta]|nr:AAA family ATPase [Andreesenia angusta]
IFDAITFALYGRGNLEGKGYEKDTRSFKSDFSNIDEEAFVEFKFEVKGKDYFIRRSPAQLVKKLRGEGLREKSEDAILKYRSANGNEVIIERLTEIREEIEKIIGLSLEQFRQIMIIPQGQFRKVISSDTKERKEILQKLFDISLCTKIQESLKEKAKIKEREIKNAENRIEDYFNILKSEIEKKDIESLMINDRLEYYENIREKFLLESKDLKVKIDSIEIEEAELNEEMGRAEIINNIIRSTEKLKKKISIEKDKKNEYLAKEKKYNLHSKALRVKSFEEKYNEVKEELKIEQKTIIDIENMILKEKCKKDKLEKNIENNLEERRKRDRIYQEIFRLENLDEKAKELDSLKYKIVDNEKILNDIIESGKKLKSEIELLEKDIEDQDYLDKINEEVNSENRELIKIVSDLNSKNYKIEDIDRKFMEYFKIKDSNIELNRDERRLTDIIKLKKENIEKLEAEYRSSNQKYNKQIIYRLRKELKSGKPCPVCGSDEHRELEIIENSDLITEDYIEKLEKELRDENEDYENIVQRYKENRFKRDESKKRLKSLLDEIKLLCEKLDIEILSEDDAREVKEKFILYGVKILQEKRKADKRYRETEKEIEELKRKIKKNRDNIKNRDLKKDEIKKQRDQYKEKNLKIEKDKDKLRLNEENLFGERKIDERISYYENYIKIISEEKKEEKKLSEKIDREDKELELIKANIEKKYGELESHKKRAKELYIKEEDKKKKYLDSLKNYGFENEEIYKLNYIEEDEINILKEDIDEYNKRVSEYEKLLNSQEKQIEGQKYSDTTILNKKIEEKRKEKKEKSEIKNEIDIKANKIQEIGKKILKEYYSNQKEIAEFEKIKDLSTVANRGNDKNISFEAYVLSAYLDEILYFTNQRFNKMTDGRYEIFRREDVVNRSSESGLDLEIFDNYSSKKRDIKTLSGGESFKASLSMALGLSDVVKMYSGGIGLDTIFIDEGFGTLDSESLDMAIDSLIEIQNQGRLVGIISHVDELKERIPDKIEIEMSSSGSKIKAFENLN